jgi:NitT/TauT family transport system ATP-binding protein
MLFARILTNQDIACLLVTHSVTEAVYLADRILVLGGTPANIIGSHLVSLDRPRETTVLGTHRFADEVASVRSLMRTNSNGV